MAFVVNRFLMIISGLPNCLLVDGYDSEPSNRWSMRLRFQRAVTVCLAVAMVAAFSYLPIYIYICLLCAYDRVPIDIFFLFCPLCHRVNAAEVLS